MMQLLAGPWLCTRLAWIILTGLVSSYVEVPILTQSSTFFDLPQLEVHPVWELLGPFQIGTREATWGADPLERLGGFHTLEYDPEVGFRSSLAPNGTVHWSRFETIVQQLTVASTRVELGVSFAEIDWNFQQFIYGWAALQYQAWARGTIIVNSLRDQQVELYTDGILEFLVDGQSFFGGDFYSFRRAPVVMHLSPGPHRLDVRLVRDVRAMGGLGQPTTNVSVELRTVTGLILVDESRLLVPDVVDGRLPSFLGSLPIRNIGQDVISITNILSTDEYTASLASPNAVEMLPGQTRPITFHISCPITCASILQLCVEYSDATTNRSWQHEFSHPMRRRSMGQSQKITFLHPGGIVSYAMLRPPSNASMSHDADGIHPLPVLINLHGAGLEAESEQLTHSLDDVADLPAWTLFPTGGSPWSADDWHQWGWADVQAAIHMVSLWIRNMQWNGPGVETSRWLVVGHSNGGQGVWRAVTHHPDNVIAAAPVSGYSSIQKYVPYTFWREGEPRRVAVVQASMNTYRHEILISNAKGVPIFQQHGAVDDNVPPYHSRRMSELLEQSGWTSLYYEPPHMGHWWNGALTTYGLRRFYYSYLADRANTSSVERINVIPSSFEIVVANPGDTDAKFGIQIMQLMDPGQLGRVKVAVNQTLVSMTTSNLQTIKLPATISKIGCLIIDRQHLNLSCIKGLSVVLRIDGGIWQMNSPTEPQIGQRSGGQLGNMEAILRTKGCFFVSYEDPPLLPTAVQITRNLFQYFGADTMILRRPLDIETTRGNLITISTGSDNPAGISKDFPIQIASSEVSIRDHAGFTHRYSAQKSGLATIFLRPLSAQRLELVIWGVDIDSAKVAARLVPMLTGVGQPDFIVLTKDCLWRGVEGVLTMGFLDSQWNVTVSSFLS